MAYIGYDILTGISVQAHIISDKWLIAVHLIAISNIDSSLEWANVLLVWL